MATSCHVQRVTRDIVPWTNKKWPGENENHEKERGYCITVAGVIRKVAEAKKIGICRFRYVGVSEEKCLNAKFPRGAFRVGE